MNLYRPIVTKCFFFILVPIITLCNLSFACDTWVAVGNSTHDGSVILGKNSDRGSTEVQPFQYVPRTKHTEKEVKCTHITIPQVEETFAHMGSHIWWIFGYEMGLNEFGVAIGNEASHTKEPKAETGLLGMDLIRLALERGKTAYGAMHIIIDLIGKYGQGGNCAHKETTGRYYTYHNAFIIADPNCAWVLETAGKYWVAKKVEDVWAISNLPSIESDFDEAHPELISHAIQMGWCRSEKDFNYARSYTDFSFRNMGNAQIRANANLSLLKSRQGDITVEDMFRISRDHHEGTIAAARWTPNETLFHQTCLHEYPPHREARTAASMVAHLRKDTPAMLRQVYWQSFSTPCVNVFKPFYFAGRTVPEQYAVGEFNYSPDSPWWWAEKTKRLCDLNYAKLAPVVQKVFKKTENWELERAGEVEREALRLINEANQPEAEKLIQQFCRENTERIETEYKQLEQTLTQMLPAVGVEYLFLDNLMKNCEIAKLELPVPKPQ
jgi:dipeptidase